MRGVVTLLAIGLLALPGAARAADGAGGGTGDRCLLYGENCPEQGDTITEKIARLEREIGRGRGVYTPGELGRLADKLEDYQRMLDALLIGGAAGD
jgi:hypothetical protein